MARGSAVGLRWERKLLSRSHGMSVLVGTDMSSLMFPDQNTPWFQVVRVVVHSSLASPSTWIPSHPE